MLWSCVLADTYSNSLPFLLKSSTQIIINGVGGRRLTDSCKTDIDIQSLVMMCVCVHACVFEIDSQTTEYILKKFDSWVLLWFFTDNFFFLIAKGSNPGGEKRIQTLHTKEPLKTMAQVVKEQISQLKASGSKLNFFLIFHLPFFLFSFLL